MPNMLETHRMASCIVGLPHPAVVHWKLARALIRWAVPHCCHRPPAPGDVIIFHPDRSLFGDAEDRAPNPAVLEAVFNNAGIKAFKSFVGLDDDVFIKRIVATAGDTVEVWLRLWLFDAIC